MKGGAKNSLIYITSSSLRAIAMLGITGPVIQTFINNCGLGSEFNYFFASFFQVIQLFTILMFSRFADGGHIFKKEALVAIIAGISIMFYIPLCIKAGSVAVKVVLIVAGIIQALGVGLLTVCDYKLPYFIFTDKSYGVTMASSGTVSSVVTMICGALITFFTVAFEYKTSMVYIFLALALCMIFAGSSQLFLKPIETAPKEDGAGDRVPMIKILKNPLFYKLVIPNLLRGFAAGTTGVFAILALQLGLGENTAASIVTVQTVAIFAGNFIFGFLSSKVPMRWLILLSSLTFLFLPLVFLSSSWIYILVVAVVLCGRTVVDYAVPVALFKVVPAEIAGPYNALRMALNTLGSVMATSLATMMAPALIVGLTLLLQIIFAVAYFTFKETKNV